MVISGSSNSLPKVSRRTPFLESCSTDANDEREEDDDFSEGARDPMADGASDVLTDEEVVYEAILGTPLRVVVDAMSSSPSLSVIEFGTQVETVDGP